MALFFNIKLYIVNAYGGDRRLLFEVKAPGSAGLARVADAAQL
jgi:hypothetical protein